MASGITQVVIIVSGLSFCQGFRSFRGIHAEHPRVPSSMTWRRHRHPSTSDGRHPSVGDDHGGRWGGPGPMATLGATVSLLPTHGPAKGARAMAAQSPVLQADALGVLPGALIVLMVILALLGVVAHAAVL